MPKLNFKIYGQGYPIIILHGLFGSLDNWQTIAKQLASHYMVYTVDQRDHGRSPKTDDFSYTLLADDLYEFMNEQWIHEAFVIGHSMGGKTTMKMALEYPGMIKKAVIVDISPFKIKARHYKIIDVMCSIDLALISSRTEIQEILSKDISDPNVVQFLMKNFSRLKTGGYELKINLPLLKEKYEELNVALEGEENETDILFIRGGASDYLKESELENIQELFSNARIETIEGAGHWVHAQKPKELLSLITSFLEEE